MCASWERFDAARPYAMTTVGGDQLGHFSTGALQRMSIGDDVKQYLNRARQCVEIAPTMRDVRQRLILLEMARAWTKLARQAEKNKATDVVYETPSAKQPPIEP